MKLLLQLKTYTLLYFMSKKIFLYGIIAYLFFSCQEKWITSDVNCNECYATKPDSADLVVYLTFEGKFTSVPLVFYRDEVNDDNNIDYVDTAYSSPYYLYSKVNMDYVVKAEYKHNNQTIFAIEKAKLKAKRVSGECDEVCWVIEGGKMNARLKPEFIK
jgi:hypothetical protein